MKVSLRVKRQHLLKSCMAILCVCLVGLIPSERQIVAAQNRESRSSRCEVGIHAPPYGNWIWAVNSNVKVYIVDPGFKPAEISYLLRPLETWNAVAELTTSRVNFIYVGTTSEPQTCDNCLTIMRGKVVNPRHAAEFEAASKQANQIVSYAKIILDPSISDLSALTNGVAHELGHNFGLLDCYKCHQFSTVMQRIRTSNGLVGPTGCDIAQVKAAYEELRQRVRPAPVIAKMIVDEGEEPVEDDTPIVIPPPFLD